MSINSKKLIIWDFDGVIADTEKMWLQTKMEMLNRIYKLNWDLQTANHFLGGMSDKTRKEVLQKLGIETNEEFWQEALQMDMQKMLKGLALTPGVEDIFKMKAFEQCIATGSVAVKTTQKIKMAGIESYFPPEKVFTADMVAFGKPEPDLFLLAAEMMGFDAKDCLVIEDSLAGLTAAQRAKMLPVAYIGSDLYHKETHARQIRQMGIEHIFDNMAEIKDFIRDC